MLSVALSRTELERRAPEVLGERCVVCPRGCKVDRRADVAGLSAIGRLAVVAAYFPYGSHAAPTTTSLAGQITVRS